MLDYNMRWNKKTTIRFTFGRLCFLGLAVIGFALMIYRLINGLGATTHLSDSWPWGFWLCCNMILSAVGSCGFAVALLAYVFHIPQYQPLARRSLLLSFLCYLLVFLIFFMDLGRWDQFYWIFVSAAWTSPLYEAVICLVLGLIVQVFQLLEVWGDRYKPWVKLMARFFLPFFVLLACVLPFGQQAAYGALYLAMPGKLHVIWYSAFLPWAFLITSFYGGLCFIALEYHLSNGYFREKSDHDMIGGVLRIAGAAMAVYLVLKGIDLSLRGVWGEVFVGSAAGNLFLLEIVAGVVIPLALTLTPLGQKPKCQMIAAVCGIFGMVLNRVNCVFTAMVDHAGTFYFPSGSEIGIVLGMIAFVLVLYLFFVENLPVFRNKEDKKPEIVIR